MVTNVSRDLAHQIVSAVKEVCGQDVNFINSSGVIFASTDEQRVGTFHEIGAEAARTGKTIEVPRDDQYTGTRAGINLPVFHNGMILAVIGITGDPEKVRKYAHLAVRITSLGIRERELAALARTEDEKRQFLIDQLTREEQIDFPVVNALLTEWGIHLDSRKRICLIQAAPRYNPVNMPLLDRPIRKLFEEIGADLYAYRYPNLYLAILEDDSFEKVRGLLQSYAEKSREVLSIGVGKASSTYSLASSLETARTALSAINESSRGFAVADDLTLELLLLSVKGGVREELLRKTVSEIPAEDRSLLRVYYQCQMSLSESCQKLYLHKNTMQYRLNRVKSRTGLDPRRFEDAVLLYLGLKLEERHGEMSSAR